MFVYNGKPISITQAFTAPDGIRYPNLKDASIRAKYGITEQADPASYDERFYWGVDNPKLLEDREEVDEEGNPLYVKVYDPVSEAMVDTDVRLVTKGLKSQWIAQVKATAGSLLAQTDWYVIRKAERSIDIPAGVEVYRAAVVAEADRLETAISSVTSVEQLIDTVNGINWPKESA